MSALAASGGVTSIASAQGGSLTGAGSTLVAPLEAQWANAFQSSHGVQVTYGAVGSGTGIQQITSRTVDFGASDAPLTPDQAAACNSCVQIPWALSATGVAFNINGVKRLKLTSSLIAGIYAGQDPQLERPPHRRGEQGREAAQPGDHPGVPQ